MPLPKPNTEDMRNVHRAEDMWNVHRAVTSKRKDRANNPAQEKSLAPTAYQAHAARHLKEDGRQFFPNSSKYLRRRREYFQTRFVRPAPPSLKPEEIQKARHGRQYPDVHRCQNPHQSASESSSITQEELTRQPGLGVLQVLAGATDIIKSIPIKKKTVTLCLDISIYMRIVKFNKTEEPQ